MAVFVFMFMMRGLPFVDLAFLHKKDLQGNVLSYRRRKTGRTLRVLLSPEALQLVHMVSNKDENSPYLFPILRSKDGTEAAYKEYQSALRRFNYQLSALKTHLNMSSHLSSYSARHTWATMAYYCEIHPGIISEAMGHSSINVTETYLKPFNDKKIDEANEKVISFVKSNGIEYDKLSEHIGLLPLVMVSPADADLIRGGSDERRRFLDLIISQQDKPYLHALIQYNKALLQRNTLLKDQSMDASLYEVLEMQLGMYGQIVYEKRKKLVEDFTPIFNEYYQTICGSAEEVGLHYISQLEETELAGKLAMSRERDRILGYTSSGIHKDELEMTLGGYLIRRVGSQGQNKTYLIALKLAQFAFLNKRGQTTPILLLDDIFDKLDASRVEQIIKLVSENGFGQIFITDTNRKYLDEILLAMNHDYALFRVERGEVQPMEE